MAKVKEVSCYRLGGICLAAADRYDQDAKEVRADGNERVAAGFEAQAAEARALGQYLCDYGIRPVLSSPGAKIAVALQYEGAA